MKKWICQGGTKECLDYFDKNLKEFGKVKKATIFFESSNFLLTSYQVAGKDIHAILENEDGQLMQLASLNCGYRGTGPQGTANMLIRLGMKPDKANWLILHTGLQLSFETLESGELCTYVNDSVFFEDRGMGNTTSFASPCPINNTTFVRMDERTIFMINPLENNPAGYYSCLKVMEPTKIDYVLNSKVGESISSAEDITRYYLGQSKLKRKERKVPKNLQIIGKKFSLHCCVPEEMLVYLIQNTHSILMGKPSKDEWLSLPASHDQQSFMYLIKEAFKSVSKKRGKPIYGSFNTPIAGGR